MLKGKNAIITGARRGIGRATVEVFARNGANVWACARTKDEAFEADMRQLAEKHHVTIMPVYFDVANEAEVKQAIQTIRKFKMSIDVLANVAGIVGEITSFQMSSMDSIRSVSKAALVGAMKNLAREVAVNHIRVNAVAPGIIGTEMGAKIETSIKEKMLEKVIMNRVGTPEEIANVIAFLGSDLSSYMTGQVVRVDGGM